MTTELTLDNLVTYIRKYGHVTFAEIMRTFEGATGECGMTIGDKNIVLWSGMSEKLFGLVTSQEFRDQIEIRGTGILTYLIDGCTLQLPIAKSGRAYKKPHWAPIVFHPRTGGRDVH